MTDEIIEKKPEEAVPGNNPEPAAEITVEAASEAANKGLIWVISSIIAIAVAFVALVNFTGEKTETASYNGFQFTNVNGFWRTEWHLGEQNYEIDFRHLPSEVENIPYSGEADERFQSKELYVTIDPTDEFNEDTAYVTLAAVELAGKLADPFDRNVTAACTTNGTESCVDRPIITCDSTDSAVIYLKEDENAAVTLNGNCAIIQGKGEELVLAVDRALFTWLTIMD